MLMQPTKLTFGVVLEAMSLMISTVKTLFGPFGATVIWLVQVNCTPPGNITIRSLEYRPSGGGYLKLTFLNVAGFISNVLVGQTQANVRTCSTCLCVPVTPGRSHASHQMSSSQRPKGMCLKTYMRSNCS